MASFLDFIDLPELQQAIAQTRAIQRERNLAVQPKAAVADVAKNGLRNAQAARELALGERRLKQGEKILSLAERKHALEQDQADFENKLAPLGYIAGAAGAGTQVLGGIRSLQAEKEFGQRMEAMNQAANASMTSLRQQNQDIINSYQGLRGSFANAGRGALAPATTAGGVPPLDLEWKGVPWQR